MSKQSVWSVALLIFLCLLAFASCSQDDKNDPAKPVITLTEVGHGNHKTVVAGNDLHLEGSILAEGVILRIDVEIHAESGDSFKIEKSYTEGKYVGVRNADFHEHIGIPAEAVAGEYHLHFSVTDRAGQTAVATSELTVTTE